MKNVFQLFSDWAKLKIKIHLQKKLRYPNIKEGELWWIHLGQNIGSEQNGKHENFERPALILKKFNVSTILIVPISSKLKFSKYHYLFVRRGMKNVANLSQIRVVSTQRLIRPLGAISVFDFQSIRRLFQKII